MTYQNSKSLTKKSRSIVCIFKRDLYVFTQVCANSKTVNGMSLVIEAEDGILVDVIGGHNDEAGKPLHGEMFTHALKSLPGNIGQVRQITRVNADSQGAVAEVIQSHGHGRKVQDATSAKSIQWVKLHWKPRPRGQPAGGLRDLKLLRYSESRDQLDLEELGQNWLLAFVSVSTEQESRNF